MYKDAANNKSNHKNLGTIRNSNLCAEIMEFHGNNIVSSANGVDTYSKHDEIACCTLASVNLSAFVRYSDDGVPVYDFKLMQEAAKLAVINLNKIIDINMYPNEETKASNNLHRPIGVGVQGLHDVFMKMRLPYESTDAFELNRNIFEALYYACIWQSIELAKKDGAYSTYSGSPMSEGLLQFDMWSGVKNTNKYGDWDILKKDLIRYGCRNSLLTALMPTASTASIFGNVESFEAITSNLYKRKVLSGEFVVLNKYMVKDLQDIGMWSDDVVNSIIANEGSVQQLPIPQELKDLYKTSWEIKQMKFISMCAERGPYIDQSQSMNIFLNKSTFENVQALHFHSWKCGLKTGLYYLRTKPARAPIKFTVTKKVRQLKCIGDDGTCESCSA